MTTGYRRKSSGFRGFEDGGSYPMANHYAGRSEIGTSDHNLPESMPVELPSVQHDDDVSGNGVFDEGPNANIDLGAFADNVSLPGYASRENGFGPSETVDWQTGTPVAVFYSGLFNNVADGGVFPTGRGADYLPNTRDMASTDFGQQLPSAPIYNTSGIRPEAVPGPRADAAAIVKAQAENNKLAAQSGYGSYAPLTPRGLTTAQMLMQRQLLSVGKPGVMDIVARRYQPGQGPMTPMGMFDDLSVPDMPLWQWAVLGVGAGAVAGAIAAVVFPGKKGRLAMSHQYGMFGAQAPYAGAPRQWTGVPAKPTFGGLGTLGAAESIESIDAIADRDGSDEEILDATSSEYVEDYNQGIPTESYQGFGGGSNIREYQFCGGYPKPTYAEMVESRESMRRRMAAHGIKTYAGVPWQKEEQDAWNAFNVSRGLQPMKLGRFPMGKQCNEMNKGPFRFDLASRLAGFGASTLTVNGQDVPIDTDGLVKGIAKTIGYAVLGYYVGSKLGPKDSSSGIAGAAACAIAGPLGLAGVAAYYSR